MKLFVAFLPVIGCVNAVCDMAHDTNRGFIGFEAPQNLTRRQNCSWNLDSSSFTNHILYVYIPRFDLRKGKTCIADVTFNDDATTISCFQRQQCTLFTRNHSNIDFDIVEKALGFSKPPCNIWGVDRGNIYRVQIETKIDTYPKFRFKLSYQYIAMPTTVEKITTTQAAAAITASPTTTITSTVISAATSTTGTYGNPSMTYVAGRNGREFQELTTSSDRWVDIEKADHSSCGYAGLSAVLGVVSVFLLIAVILLFVCWVKMKQKHSGKRQPRIRGSFYQTDSVDGEVDLAPVHSPPHERKVSRSAFTRFSKLHKKNKIRDGTNDNFIHFTLTRDGSEAPKRTKSLPDVAVFQVNPPEKSKFGNS